MNEKTKNRNKEVKERINLMELERRKEKQE